MKSRSLKAVALLALAASASPAFAQLKAFEDAEGFGQFAEGARRNLAANPDSVSVYHVTTLADSGPGSFRDAVSQGNRFIVFDVGGIITLNSLLAIDKDNLTIAGQTAPGGIALYGDRVSFSNADNLIARHFAIRKGEAGTRADAAGLSNGANMIFDHMSVTWGVDETFSMNWDGKGNSIDRITIQNSIIAQGQDRLNHSAGGLMTLPEGGRFSIIKSIFADNDTRNPKVRGENEFINNVVYGWTSAAYIMGDTDNMDSHANAVGNYFIEGPANGSAPFTSGTSRFQIYAQDNFIDNNNNGVLDGTLITNYPGATVVNTPFAFPTNTSTAMSAQDALAYVLENAGPNITRDAVDARIVEEIRSYGTLGGVIQRETDLFPGYGTDAKYLSPRARLTDADNDGMADAWELSKGLSPADATDWKTLNGQGYTRLEEYVNSLATKGANFTSTGGEWTASSAWINLATPNIPNDAFVDGTMTVSAPGAIARNVTSTGSLIVSAGTLDIFDTAAFAGNVNLTGGKTTFGRLVLSPTSTLSLRSGASLSVGVIASSTGSGASFQLDGGTLLPGANAQITVPTTITANGGTIDTGANPATLSGRLSSSGSLTKVGAGTLTLSGNNNTFTGNLNLTGNLRVAHSNGAGLGTIQIGATAAQVQLANGVNMPTSIRTAYNFEVLDVVDANATATFSGSLTGASTSNQIRMQTTGAGALLNLTGTVTAPSGLFLKSGNFNVAGNAQVTGSSANVGRGVTLATTLTLRDSATFAFTNGLSMGGGQTALSGTITVRDNATLSTYAASLDLLNTTTATGSGTLNLNGGTTIAGGIIKTSTGATQTASLNFNGGLLQYGGAVPNANFLPALSGLTARVQAGGARFDDVGQSIRIAAPLIHDAALGATLDGGLTKSGPGTLTLAGNNTYTGPTTVNAGTLSITGAHTGGGTYAIKNGAILGGTGSTSAPISIESGGTISPGLSPGNLSTGSLTLGPGANFALEIAAFAPGSFDTLTVTGAVNLGSSSNLQLTLPAGYTLNYGDAVTFILNDGSDLITGTFATVNGVAPVAPDLFTIPTPAGALQVQLAYTAGGNDASLTVVPEPSFASVALVALPLLSRRRRVTSRE